MLNIGLTGGIGAGKSEAARRFAAHGAIVIDADRLAREVVAPGTDGLAAVVAAFGSHILAADGSLDRARVAEYVFSDPAQREKLNAIIHPLVRERTAAIVAAADPDDIAVHDVPLLVENQLMDQYDIVVVVQASIETRLARLARRGLAESAALQRIAAQASDAARASVANYLIHNDGDLAELHTQVDLIWADLKSVRTG